MSFGAKGVEIMAKIKIIKFVIDLIKVLYLQLIQFVHLKGVDSNGTMIEFYHFKLSSSVRSS